MNYLIHSDVHGNPVHTHGRRRFQGDNSDNEGQDMAWSNQIHKNLAQDSLKYFYKWNYPLFSKQVVKASGMLLHFGT